MGLPVVRRLRRGEPGEGPARDLVGLPSEGNHLLGVHAHSRAPGSNNLLAPLTGRVH